MAWLTSQLPRVEASLEGDLSFAHVDDTGHIRVQSAKVAEIALLGEGVFEAIVRVHCLGDESPVAGNDRVRSFIMVGPDDLGARRYGDFLWRKCEFLDRDRGRANGARVECERGQEDKQSKFHAQSLFMRVRSVCRSTPVH